MTRKGVWDLQEVRDKYLASLWNNPTTMWLAGFNEDGSMGQNLSYAARAAFSSPTQIDGDWNDVAILERGTVASKTDGTLWAWGKNTYGQIGQNNTTSYSSPKQIPGTTWKRVSGGRDVAIATKTDGTLWAWGDNGNGQLGDNSAIRKSSPVQVGSDTDWDWPVAGGYGSGAVKTDGTFWTWGNNDDYMLGHNDKTQRSSPVQIGSNVIHAEMSKEQLYFVSGSTGRSCGKNNEGCLGHNNQTNYSSPKQIPGSWKALSCGSAEVAGGIRTDGTLWVWGSGTSGVMAEWAGTNYSSPKQIGTGTTWATLTGSKDTNSNFVATKTDGTLWAWGSGTGGKLMQNSESSYSSPKQIPGTLWSLNWWQHAIDGSNSDHASMQGTLTPSQL